MAIKAMRYQIIKPAEDSVGWNELGEVLRDLRYAASKIANLTMQKLYAWESFKRAYKEQHGVYPNPKEHKDQWYSNYWYTEARKRFPHVSAQTVNQIGRHAEKLWNSRKKQILSLQQSLPSFKLNFPICCHNKDGYSVYKQGSDYIVSAALLSKSKEKTRYSFIIKVGDKSKRAILDRIISGEYRKCALQIVSDRKKKWYCIIPYEFTLEKSIQLDKEKIMGIDLGITNAAYWAFNNSLKRGKIEGKEIEEFRRRVQKRRKSIQQQGKYCGDGRIGHGLKRRLKPIETLKNKEANFRNTTNRRYAKRLVEVAVREKCGVIQMEDLSGIRNSLNNKFLANWPYYDLQQKIIEKAAEYGIEVRKIPPAYTSQRCSKCGYIHKDNRIDQANFICTKCGYGSLYHCFACGSDQKESGNCNQCGQSTKQITVHADFNAAKNIATPNINIIIQQQLKNQETDDQ